MVFIASASTFANAQTSGPLTGVHPGNLVETPRGLRPLHLEGFSEDLDEDGYVDPLVSVAEPAAAVPVAPAVEATLVSVPAVSPVVPLTRAIAPHRFPVDYPYVSSPVAHPTPFFVAQDAYPAHSLPYSPPLAHYWPHFGYGLGVANHGPLLF